MSIKRMESVIDRLRKKIVDGALAPGSKVIEMEIAAELGCSRTPLREALRALEREGLVRAESNRGCWIAPLDADEIRDLYPIIWTLESLALRDGWSRVRARVTELRRANESLLGRASKPAQAARSDREFHEVLTSGTGNTRLRETLASLKERVGRYEALYMRDSGLIKVSHAHHRAIIKGVAADDFNQAERALEENWRFGMESLLAHLRHELRAHG